MFTELETSTHGDFVVLRFLQCLAGGQPDLPTPIAEVFAHAGPSCTKEFLIDGQPAGPGYATLQLFDLTSSTHTMLINGVELPRWDVPGPSSPNTWFSWTEAIPEGLLVRGSNQITLRCTDEEARFLVRDVIVHWHERRP